MFTAYQFQFGTLMMEYEGDILYKLTSVPEYQEITLAMRNGRFEFSDDVFRQVEEFLRGKRKSFDLKYELKGTDFQMKVWAALHDIPYGETRSYKQIAEAIGNPAACRAVGMANNRNPLILIVPCHRVIGSNGDLVGYACGLEMKRALLDLEKRNSENIVL